MKPLNASARAMLTATLVAALLILSACAQENIRREAPPATETVTVDDSIRLMFTRALTHLQQQEYDEGIDLLETLTAKENRLAAPFVNLGIAYSRTGNNKKAEYNFSRALKLDAGHAVANNELGLLYRKTGRFGAARSAYQNALVDHPDYLPVRKNLGILCELYLQPR